jgi:hypothetical protein
MKKKEVLKTDVFKLGLGRLQPERAHDPGSWKHISHNPGVSFKFQPNFAIQ